MKRLSTLLTTNKKPRKKIKSDPQAHKVYHMERNDLVGMSVNTFSSIDHLQALANSVCRRYGISKAKVVIYSNPDERAYGHTFAEGKIILNKSHHGANVATLLHELAHHIEWQLDGFGEEDHGPRFMRYYIELMHTYKMLPAYAFESICNRRGINYEKPVL